MQCEGLKNYLTETTENGQLRASVLLGFEIACNKVPASFRIIFCPPARFDELYAFYGQLNFWKGLATFRVFS